MSTPGMYPDYIRSWTTPAGVILIELTGHRLRVTDYLPGSIEQVYKVGPTTSIEAAVRQFCELNRWGLPHLVDYRRQLGRGRAHQ